MAKSLLKVTVELPTELEQWCGVLLQDAFPDGFLSEPVRGGKLWFKVTGWLSNQRRLNSLRHQVEGWGGRRFLFEVEKPKKAYASAPVAVQKIGGFVIHSEGTKAPEGRLPRIQLRQGQAFGTGLHESTRLILKALGTLPAEMIEAKEVLDIGAGTGVLGFAAMHRGAKRVIAIEKDKASREDLKFNRRLNNISARKMSIYPSGFPNVKLKGKKLPIIVANILTPIHVELMSEMKKVCSKGGRLFLSGIYGVAEASQVRKAARAAGFKVLKGSTLKQWQLVVLQKP